MWLQYSFPNCLRANEMECPMNNHELYQDMLIALIDARAMAECEDHPEQYFQEKMILETDAQILQLRSRNGTKDFKNLTDDEFCELVRSVYNDHPSQCNLYH